MFGEQRPFGLGKDMEVELWLGDVDLEGLL